MARENVSRFFGEAPNWTLIKGDAYEQFEAPEIDRVVIDVPEPCLDGGGGLNFKGPTFDVEDGSPRSVDSRLHCVGTGFMPEDEPEPEPEPDCTEFV